MKFQLIDISTLSSGHGRDAFLLWGRTAAGKAVSLRVSGFQPYVLVKRVPRESKEYLADVLRDMMKQEKKYWNRKKKEMDVFTVAGPWFEIEECKGRSVRDVSSESLKNGSDIFWKISTRGRRDIYTLKKTLRSKDFSTRTARGSHVETTLYNCNIPPALRWMLDCNIKPCYWISCEPESTYNGKLYQWIRSTKRTRTVRVTACLGNCSWDRVACEYDNAVAPLILAVLDIETLPFESERSKEERLKDPTLSPVIEFRGPEHDQILQISLVSCRTNAMGSVEHTIFMIGEDETHIPEKYDDGDFQPSKATVRVFKEEKDMLVAFCHAIIALDPDILSGYNVTNFDMKYIWTRAELLMCKHALSWSRIFGYVCQMSKKIFKNRAFGSNELFVFDVPGRIVFDLYQHMKKAHKLSSYKLDTVAEKFLGTKKMPVSYADIPKLQETREGRLEMAAYCLKDSWLVVRLIAHLCTMSNLAEMSRVCGITMNDVLSRGQMIRSLTNIYYYAKRHKPEYFLPEFLSKDETKKTRLQYLGAGRNQSISLKRKTLEEEVDAPGFKGAVVITPKPGWYDESSFVTCLDFASLYPSIMRWKNMCYSTIVSPDVIEKNGLVEDVDYHRIRKVVVDDADNIQRPLPQARSDVCFLTAKRRLGILPVILETLLAARKRAKKDMKTATTEHSRKIANGRQLALKVVCNSLYGFTGTWYGYLPEQRIASSVTETGRHLALVTKKMCEENYAGCKCVYGDSVLPDTPLLLRHGDVIQTVRIDELEAMEQWFPWHNSKQQRTVGTLVWTDQGWSTIRNVVRHRSAKPRQIIRVLTHTGVVDVTTDHSLLNEHGKEVKPSDVEVGSVLKHVNLPIPLVYDTAIGENEAWLMGLFFGDGSACVCLTKKYGIKYTWKISNNNVARLEKARDIMRELGMGGTIYDCMASSAVYNVHPVGKQKEHAIRYRALFYNAHKEKIVPPCILNAPVRVVQSFFDGYYEADGDKDKHGYCRCDCKGKEGSLGLYYIGQRLGYNVYINTRRDKKRIFRLTFTRATQRKRADAIKKLYTLHNDYDGYVYDLTTDNHHFHVGPGRMVVHNTDSVFIQVPKIQLSLKAQTDKMVAVHEVAALSEKMAAFCDKSYPNNADGVINLEFEKIYSPFLLLKKKRYVGYKYEEGKLKKPEIDFKGIELTRRDGCGLTKKWMRDILPMVFIKNDVAAARVYIESNLKGVYAGSLPIDMFVSSKQLSKKPSEYKNKPEHVVLAERLMKDPINRISIGDRIHFVIRAGFRGEKIRDRAVLPRDIEEGHCVLDLDYYTEKKLHIPLRGLLSHVIKDIDELFLSASMKAPRQRNFQKSRVGRMFAKKRRREDLIGEQARERKRKQVDAIMNSLQTEM